MLTFPEDALLDAIAHHELQYRLGAAAAEQWHTLDSDIRSEAPPNPYRKGTPQSLAWTAGWASVGDPDFEVKATEPSYEVGSGGPIPGLEEHDPEPGKAGWIPRKVEKD